MPALSGIYDSALVQPVAKIKENLSIWTGGVWTHWLIEYLEPMPPGPASTVDMVALSGATTLAAGGTITKQAVAALQLNTSEFLQTRWEPLNYVEGLLWEQAGQARFNSRTVHARVSPTTRLWDPYLATTTFFILGMNRDMNLEVRNPMAAATPVARFIFWGFRYLVVEYINLRGEGNQDKVKAAIGQTTWLPAEGRGSAEGKP